jgi:hypothetical protein
VGAAGAATTLTITGIDNARFLIHRIFASRATNGAEAAAAAGTISTTGIHGTPSWKVPFAVAAGGKVIDIDVNFPVPLETEVGTSVTIVGFNPGTTPLWTIQAFYEIEVIT